MKKLFLLGLLALFASPRLSAQCDSLLSDSAIDRIACENEKILLNLGVYAYRKGGIWSSPELGSSNANSVKQSFSYSQDLTYTYRDNSTGCSASESIYIKVNPLPSVNAAKPADVCANEPCFSLVLNGTPLGGVWTADNSTKNYMDSGKFCPSKVNVPTNQFTNVYLKYTYTDLNGCSSSSTTAIIVRGLPDIKVKDSIQMLDTDSFLLLDKMIDPSSSTGGSWSGPGVVNIGGKPYFLPSEVQRKKGFYNLVYTYTNNGAIPRCSARDTTVIELTDQLVSTGDTEPMEQLQVYPNPSQGVVVLQHVKAFQYRVFDVNGKLIESSASFLHRSELQLEEGVYWLSVHYQSGQRQTQTVVVQ